MQIAGTTTVKLMSRGKERTYCFTFPAATIRKSRRRLFCVSRTVDKAPDFLKGIDLEREADKRTMIAIARRDWESYRAGMRGTVVGTAAVRHRRHRLCPRHDRCGKRAVRR